MVFADFAQAWEFLEEAFYLVAPLLEWEVFHGVGVFVFGHSGVYASLLEYLRQFFWCVLQEFLSGGTFHEFFHFASPWLPVLDIVQFVCHGDGSLGIVVGSPEQPVSRLLAESGMPCSLAQLRAIEGIERLDDGLLALRKPLPYRGRQGGGSRSYTLRPTPRRIRG